VTFFLLSCNKNIVDDYPPEGGCERYAGLWDMYDPDNDIHYNMTILCESGKTLYSTFDSVHYTNFANLFVLGHGVGIDGTFSGTIIQLATDKNGYRWSFSNNYYPDTLNRINVLLGDSIYLYFHIVNTSYWMDDSVPFQDITTVHSGVKVH